MGLVVQGSLFDAVGDPGGATDAAVPALVDVPRVDLGSSAWVDLLPGWLHGADALFDRLLDAVPWVAERRRMYERVVDVPRLLAFYAESDELPDPVLTRCRDALNDYYAKWLGEPLLTAGLCLYRDGRDSVAWHGDTIGRGKTTDTMVAIVSLGDPRKLHLRPRVGGAEPIQIEMGHGDLVVMGGSCQRTWEHAVPKVAHSGPRISVQFRPLNVF
jgi:alkylated DNA repair dioxygenase AlkB